ncbi:CPBP family intramembrane glutamic endopeptidase [Lactiplantibacillus paraplantarum]|uniref:CPBP family intramembrane glutamic endopeptidase n=1 Tax=Lactiplantibacillus paraplantarum TaxID=60520 RepID=UPI0023AB4E6F|nr:CPBP family intramembrane glutamic endopeptidase [Lactiplantibacillus paraplantarum]WEE36263.1 CPBP family intramembrane metalloprotease [Lactiplantibacillus paraplantarum]
MQLTKHGWGAVISIFILVPLLFKLSALLPVPTLYSGLTQDLLILLLFLLLNHFWFKIPIKWWHSQSLAHQNLQLIPGIIILLLPMTSNYIKLFQLARTPILGFYIGYTLLIGITEEYLYRGMLLPLLRDCFPNRIMLAICIDSLLFGFTHLLINSSQLTLSYVIPQVFYAAMGGLVFCGLYLRTNNLVWSMMLHALSDVSVIVSLATHTHTAAKLSIPTAYAIGISVLYLVLFIIVAFIIRWQVRPKKSALSQ